MEADGMEADGGTVRAIADELTERHGGCELLGVSGRAIVFQIASLLAGDMNRTDAATIAALKGLLPVPAEADEADLASLDLSRLSDAELEALSSVLSDVAAKCATTTALPTFSDRLVASFGERDRVVAELAAERRLRWDQQSALDEARRSAAVAEGEAARLRAALAEAAGAIAAAKAAAGTSSAENAPAGSAEAPGANVVRLRPPGECQECNPSPQTDYSWLSGTAGDRFDNDGRR
jgi:hypothetical protein